MNGKLSLCAILFGILLQVSPVGADETALRSRLSVITREVTATEAFLDTLKKEFGLLQRKKTKTDAHLAELADTEKSLTEKLTKIERERHVAIQRVVESEQDVARRRDSMRKRVAVMYKLSALGSRPKVRKVSTGSNRVANRYFMREVRVHDTRRIRELGVALEKLQKARNQLDLYYERERAEQRNLQENLKDAEQQRARLVSLIGEMKRKQAAAKSSLLSLQGKARLLDQLLQNILDHKTDEEHQPTRKIIPRTSSSGQGSKKTLPVDTRTSLGLFEKDGQLFRPVVGAVRKSFGRRRVRNFADMVFTKGIEIEVGKGAQVVAVKSGRVAYAGTMPGYEKVVVIDHGGRTHSLYGRLAEFSVNVGDMITGGSPIGRSSSADQSSSQLYFEIRKNGKAVNPSQLHIF